MLTEPNLYLTEPNLYELLAGFGIAMILLLGLRHRIVRGAYGVLLIIGVFYILYMIIFVGVEALSNQAVLIIKSFARQPYLSVGLIIGAIISRAVLLTPKNSSHSKTRSSGSSGHFPP